MKVTVMARIRQDGKQPFVKPVWQGTRLKAGVVILNGVETKRDDVSYYLRYTRGGKQITEPAHSDVNDVLTFQKRVLATLQAEANGLAISGAQIVPMPQKALEGTRITIQKAIDDYLDDLRLAKRPPATIADKQNHLTAFTNLIHKVNLDEYSRGDVLRFKDNLEGQEYAPKTVENFMMSVVVFFNEQKIDLEMRESDYTISRTKNDLSSRYNLSDGVRSLTRLRVRL